MSGTVIYTIWLNMVARCTNPNNDHYHRYGGRGITVCERWLEFENFYADMGDCPSGLELDREENNEGYCKSNCRWVTHKVNHANREISIKVNYLGVQMSLMDASEASGIAYGTLQSRLYRKCPTVQLFHPVGTIRKRALC